MCHLFDRSARAVIFIYSSDWKTQLGRRCWDLASCQISLNPVQQFQRRSQKCLSQSWAIFVEFRSAVTEKKSKMYQPIRGWTAILFFRSARKTQTWKMTLRSSFFEFRSAVSSEKSKISQPIRGQGGHLVFQIGAKNTNLVEDVKSLLSCQVSLNSVQWFQKRSRKCLSQSEARAAILFLRWAPITQNW